MFRKRAVPSISEIKARNVEHEHGSCLCGGRKGFEQPYNITDRRRTERELRLVIDTIPAMSWSTLADGAVDYCSKSWMEYTGMKSSEAVGSAWLNPGAKVFRRAVKAPGIKVAIQTGGNSQNLFVYGSEEIQQLQDLRRDALERMEKEKVALPLPDR